MFIIQSLLIQYIKGSTTYYELVFTDDENLPYWDPSMHVVLDLLPVEEEGRKSCNTCKDRDKRQNRHTCGIFIGLVDSK